MQNRDRELEQWLGQTFEGVPIQITPLQGDASFRRYFRLTCPEHLSYIVMDAPPEREALALFLSIATSLRTHGIHTPRIVEKNLQAGFAVLEDFGDTLLLLALENQSPAQLYTQAFDTLHRFQTWSPSDLCLAHFDEHHMMQELSLFKDWFLKGYLNITLTQQEALKLGDAFSQIIEKIMLQPTVPIHRDYHARNLMLLDTNTLGVIDFQDAMIGPLTYDLVSLLKDCYVRWSPQHIHQWMTQFYYQSPIAQTLSLESFKEAFEWCGIQRHLKVLGIFARLHLRDNKPGYLQSMHLPLDYLKKALQEYAICAPLSQLIEEKVSLP